jgi:hypothetical protein
LIWISDELANGRVFLFGIRSEPARHGTSAVTSLLLLKFAFLPDVVGG